MKKFLAALCATVLSAGIFAADYSQKVTSNVALLHGVPGPMDFSQLFLSQADFDYYCSTGGMKTGVSAEWLAIRPLPYAGQIVALSVDGQTPKAYVLKARADGMFDHEELAFSADLRDLRTADGTARPLPPYLFALQFDDTYTNDAAWYYDRADTIGHCSARVNKDGLLERNYDWTYNDSAVFVVSMSAGEGRFASLGVASVGTNLTEKIVTSGVWSPFYKCLPGMMLDGVNEKGIAAEINVVALNGSAWETKGSRTLNMMGGVRWVLDHATDVKSAAEYVAANAYIPQSIKTYGYSIHMLITDGTTTYIVEDGAAFEAPSITQKNFGRTGTAADASMLGYKVMTNFRLKNNGAIDEYGSGYERFDILAKGGSISDVWYKKAFTGTDVWYSELASPSLGSFHTTDGLNAIKSYFNTSIKGKTPVRNNNPPWWQTVHSSVYDLKNKTLRIAVQEVDDWYVFALPPAGFESRIGKFTNDGKELSIGSGASNPKHLESVTLNGCARYPSQTYGFANVNIGLDNISGFGDDGTGGIIRNGTVVSNAYYDVVIGTSSSAKYMHSYVFGSQSHALAENSFIFGYGATSLDGYSTIIGFGSRPQPDKKFNTHAEMLTWFKSFSDRTAASKDMFVDMMLSVTNDTVVSVRVPQDYNGDYYIKSIRTTKHSTYGWVELYQDAPHLFRDEYIRGRHNWNYGKTHGRGTVNLVAQGSQGRDPGLSGVFINDNSLADLTGIHNGESRVMTNFVGGAAVVKTQKDFSVSIGENAQANGSSGDHTQNVSIGRDADSPGEAAMAIGPNAFAYGSRAIAVGWRANAVGAQSIAIGAGQKSGENYFKTNTMNGVVNPNSDLALAEGAGSIVVGFNAKAKGTDSVAVGRNAVANGNNALALGAGAKATGAGAVQLGSGNNTNPGTIQIGDVTIYKDGHVVGTGVEHVEVDVTESSTSTDYDYDIEVTPGSITTVLPSKPMEGEEIGVHVKNNGSRTFTLYLPNEPEVRNGGPWNIASEIPSDVKVVFKNNKTVISKLPCRITSEQPYSKLVVFNIEEIDDGYDWTPMVTNVCVTYDAVGGKFVTEGKASLYGESLHMCTKYQLKYTTTSDATETVDLMELKDGANYMVGTLYPSIHSVSYTCPSDKMPKLRNGEIIDFEIIYETVNGRAKFRNPDGTTLDTITKSVNIAD